MDLLSANNSPNDTFGHYNTLLFIVQQALSKMQTAALVRIDACTTQGEVGPVGLVDATPLVNQVDNSGQAWPHISIHNLPYLRIQGGTNAVIMDPQMGDIGIAVFASRDISKVKATKAQANPGSARSYDFADGMYLGGVLNGTPQQYVRFTSTGIEVVSPTLVTIQAPTIAMKGDVTMNQKLTVTGDVTAQGTSLHLHKHNSAAAGQPTSPPLP